MNSSRTKKISIILPDLRGGGVERMRIHLAKEFIKQGHHVEFVLFQKRGELLGLVPTEAKIIDLKAGRLIKGFYPLVQYLNHEKSDAVLAAIWPLSVMTAWAVRFSRVNPTVVVSEHNQIGSTPVFERFGNRWIIPFTMKIFYPKADAVVGASNGVLQHLKELSGLQLPHGATIYNPAAPSDEKIQNSEDRSDEIFRKKGKRIIAIGTLKEQKDYPTLLRAFKIVQQKVSAELLILGDGPERINIKTLINELNLQGIVHLTGFVQNPLSYLKGSDLFVLSSAWEGFGNVIVEALACGVPVVSTDCKSGPAEILENGKYGRLVPVGDPQALAEAIMEELKKEHDPEPLKERAMDFTAEKIADQYLELLFPGNERSIE